LELFAAALSILLAACRGEDRISHDLVEMLSSASLVPETSSLDFGADEARAALRLGFSVNERDGGGSTFVWSEGDRSEIRLVVSDPRPLSLTLRLWPFRFPGAPPQSLSFSLNGTAVAEVELVPGPGEYRLSLPEAALQTGENLLRTTYAYSRSPNDLSPSAGDGRRLAVAWDWLRVEGASIPRAPEARGSGLEASLVLPAGSGVQYFLTAPEGGRLVIDALRSESPTSFTIVLDTATSHWERRVEPPARELETPLLEPLELTRIALHAGGHDLVLHRPRVLSSDPAPRQFTSAEKRRPNVIVYLIDTLRADHLGCYGYSKPTPAIDAFAGDGTLFERAVAQSSWTRPATASILTGLPPRAHNANRREDALPPSIPTLGEALVAAGYETAGLVVNANVSAPFGFDRGFQTFELLLHEDGILGASGDRLVDRAIEWLDQRSSEKPFFLYLHTTDPHDPYGTTGFGGEGFGTVSFLNELDEGRVELSSGDRERLVGLYDQDVAFADAQFGRFVGALKERGIYRDALIVLLSDHGEEFEDHGRWRHGKTLYAEQLAVPLVVKWPGGVGSGRRVSGIAQHIDVAPTILEFVGAEPALALPGRDLFFLAAGEPASDESAAVSYLLLDERELESIVASNRKLIRTLRYDRQVDPYQLFDLSTDAEETRSLLAQENGAARFLEAYLRHLTPSARAAPAPVAIEGDVERQLRALGYVR
jgi:arylsulfatase A-like enzyme